MTKTWRLRSGERVEDRGDRSHLIPGLLALLPEILGRVDAGHVRPTGEVEVHMGRVVGDTICVETTAEDEIVFALRPGRAGVSRFVRGRQAVPTSHVTLVLGRSGRGFFVITGYFGRLASREPWDVRAGPAASAFWRTHALVWDSASVVSGTETTDCPHCRPHPTVRPWPTCVAQSLRTGQ